MPSTGAKDPDKSGAIAEFNFATQNRVRPLVHHQGPADAGDGPAEHGGDRRGLQGMARVRSFFEGG